MKKLNITKERFEKSRYFKNKYGRLEYVSESGKVFKTDKGKVLMFKEGVHPHEIDADVPVTKQEELLCKYIPDEIEEFCSKNGLEVSCYCSEHQTGEEQHIEIYVGIPEDEDNTDPKYDNIESNLEMLVNDIGDAENEGEKWGDASFQWISDNELFGELWPLEQSQVNESSRKFVKESKRVNEGLFSNDHSGVVGDALAKALDNALDKAFDCFDDELRRQGFSGYDGDGEGGFYFNDEENRKTYYVCLGLTHLQECEDYEGDYL